jgi:hypothetical protein
LAAVSLKQAVSELGISRATLLRSIAEGAPVAQRGGRGRGRQTLVDPVAIAAWREARAAEQAEQQQLLEIAGVVPELVADAVHAAFVQIEGAHKRAAAGLLTGAWYLIASALLDELRRRDPRISELTEVPEKVSRLRVIFDGSGTVTPGSK